MPSDEPLPSFVYHPDPIDTGSIVPSDTICIVCGQGRGHFSTVSIYSVHDVGDQICPWCIADGRAHAKFDAEFTDIAGVGSYNDGWEVVPREVAEMVAYRTPGFASWQGERWWTHCGDAAAFLGPAGRRELETRWPDAIVPLWQETGLPWGREWEEFFRALDRDHGPTAYVFRCRHCGAYGGYWDCH